MTTGRIELLAPAAGEILRADVAVVGTGAGAAAVTGAVRRAGLSALMVEAGQQVGRVPAAHARNDEVGDANLVDAMAEALVPHANAPVPLEGLPGGFGIHRVGGMLTLWSNYVPRPDLELEWGGVVPTSELSALLDEAGELLWATEDLYEGAAARQKMLLDRLHLAYPELDGSAAPRPIPIAARRSADGRVEYAAADTLLQADDNAGSVSILPGFVVRGIEHDGSRATALLAYRLDGGDAVRVEAEVIVVAAGVLGTPQLLVASGIDASPALGRYLTDHLNMVGRVLIDGELQQDIEGDDPAVSLFVPVSDGRPFQSALIEIPGDAIAGVLNGVDRRQTIDIGTFVGTEPEESNGLKFDNNSLDAFGLPAITARVGLTRADREHVAQAIGEHYRLAEAVGEPWFGMTLILRPFASSLHLMGTHRMGADPETSVVDDHSRVWGWENLYLAGNGVLPSRNSCNPTLTTVALGLRAAQAIIGGRGAT